jgi:hypothetical protein
VWGAVPAREEGQALEEEVAQAEARRGREDEAVRLPTRWLPCGFMLPMMFLLALLLGAEIWKVVVMAFVLVACWQWATKEWK